MTQVNSFGLEGHTFAAGFIGRIRQALGDYRLYRATLEELQQLTDRDLADLGLHRSSIPQIARESVYGA